MAHETILITGCSTGIGRATAVAAHGAGHTVVATARRLESLDDLPAGIHRVRLDVCETESVTAAVAEANDLTGGITAVVNNAGFGQSGPIELVTEDQVAGQFETNVNGPLRVIRAVLPQFRAAGHGTVVNVSSAAGRFSTPFLGIYCASKFALEALSDALRIEVAPFGVRVVVVEPGPIATSFGDVALHSATEGVLDDPTNPYYTRAQRVTGMSDALERFTKQPEDVARVIVKAIGSKRPRARYTVTIPAKLAGATQLVPARFMDYAQGRALDS